MTGTADTEAEEFAKIYKLDVVVVPTTAHAEGGGARCGVPLRAEKWEAIILDIIEKQKTGRPVLVGTVSVEKSEKLSSLLKRRGVKHVVLNAKYHAMEAEIVAQAGRLGTVTIATNMAAAARHPARRQRRVHDAAAMPGGGDRRTPAEGQERFVDDEHFAYYFHIDAFYRVPRADYQRIFTILAEQCEEEHERSSRSTGCTSSAPSGTRRAASTTSCVAAPAGRATPGPRGSTCPSRTT